MVGLVRVRGLLFMTDGLHRSTIKVVPWRSFQGRLSSAPEAPSIASRTCFLNPLEFEPSKTDAFRHEKNVEANVVQLDLLTGLPRRKEDESVLKIRGATSSLQHCLVDGAEDLGNHIETIKSIAERCRAARATSVGHT